MEKDPKLRPLYVAQILYERTDEGHYLRSLTRLILSLIQRTTSEKCLLYDAITRA